ARVPDRRLAVEAAQFLLVEDLRDKAHVAEHGQPAVVGDRDPGRFLAAVLEREQAEVRDARDVPLRGADAEHAAHQGTVPSSRVCGRSGSGPARTTDPYGASPFASKRWPLKADASLSACARPPSLTSCASENRCALRQSHPIRSTSSPSTSHTRSPGRQPRGTSRTSGTSPTQPTTGVGGIARPS